MIFGIIFIIVYNWIATEYVLEIYGKNVSLLMLDILWLLYFLVLILYFNKGKIKENEKDNK